MSTAFARQALGGRWLGLGGKEPPQPLTAAGMGGALSV